MSAQYFSGVTPELSVGTTFPGPFVRVTRWGHALGLSPARTENSQVQEPRQWPLQIARHLIALPL